MSTPEKSNVSPCAMVDLWVQMHGTPEEKAVIAAFNLKGWKNGTKQLDQVEISAYSNIPLRTLKRVLQRMVAKQLLLRRFGPGRVYIYEKNVVEMTWDECHELGRSRIKEMRLKCQSGTLDKNGSKGQTGTPKVPSWPRQSAKVVPSNVIKDFSKDIKRESGAPPLASLSTPTAETKNPYRNLPKDAQVLNEIRKQVNRPPFPDTIKGQQLYMRAVQLYGPQLVAALNRFHQDKHWIKVGCPLNAFANETQAHNWLTSENTPAPKKCQHLFTISKSEPAVIAGRAGKWSWEICRQCSNVIKAREFHANDSEDERPLPARVKEAIARAAHA